jgi:hypothetical protein
MRIKLIEELPMATSAELYQLSWVIEQLLADPRRIVQVRAQLHTGQQVQYLHWADGKLRSARIVGMHGDHVAVQDAGYSKAFKVHYAAILTERTPAPTDSGPMPADVELTKPAPATRSRQPRRLPRGPPGDLHRQEPAAPGWPDRARQSTHCDAGL